MKKACIFTFHNVPNYGAALQAFALSHYVEKELDYHVDIMDFHCKGNGLEFEPDEYIKTSSKSSNMIAMLYKKFKLTLNYKKDYRKKYIKFQDFKKRWLPVIPYNKNYVYDAIILGSDQIWNPVITGGFQEEFFGQCEYVKSKVSVAYAASCGDITSFTDKQKEELVKYVTKIDHVGVREKSLSRFLLNEGIENVCTLDPTFLLTSEEYNELTQYSLKNSNPYILVYELQRDNIMENLAFKIARERNIEVRVLAANVSLSKKKQCEIRDAGPIEFLSLVKEADYILTNSFHGTAFSLIYKKDFSVYLPKSRTSRIVDLLNEVGLTERIINNDSCESDVNSIDYSIVEKKIEGIRVSSKLFLQEALGGTSD